MPDIVDTALLVLNQCSLQCYGFFKPLHILGIVASQGVLVAHFLK